jgi:hypothetical protein
MHVKIPFQHLESGGIGYGDCPRVITGICMAERMLTV